jgi:hypothetical protein
MNPADPLAQYTGALGQQSVSQQHMNASMQNRRLNTGSAITASPLHHATWTDNTIWNNNYSVNPFQGFIDSQEYNEALDKYLMRVYIESENAIKLKLEKETKEKEEQESRAKEARHQAYLKLKEEFEVESISN